MHPTRLNLINSQSYTEIKKDDLKQIHMGLIVIGIKGVHHEGLGTNVFITLYDFRFTNPEQSILGCMEVDMNQNGQIIYFVPDISDRNQKFLFRY